MFNSVSSVVPRTSFYQCYIRVGNEFENFFSLIANVLDSLMTRSVVGHIA